MTTEQTVISILNQTKDPLTGLSALELNLACHLEELPSGIKLRLVAGFPGAALEQEYLPALKTALQTALPSQTVETTLETTIKSHRTQLAGKGLRGVKNTIAIASGKGGVGKSTVTVNLAVALAKLGAKVGILDADIYGPSIPLMLGAHKPVELAGDQYLPVEAHGIKAMSIGYLTDNDTALIWRGPMLAKSLIQMLDITLWDDLDYLFIDLPPGTGDIQLTLVQKIPLTGAIVVTTPQQVATLDAQKALNMFAKTNIDVLGVIENMATHQCSSCGHEEAIFGSGGAEALCKTHQCQLLAQLPLDTTIRQQSDIGVPVATDAHSALAQTFQKAALQASIAIAQKPQNYADKFPNIVVE